MYGRAMWWNDIREIKEGMGRLTERLGRIDYSLQRILYREQEKSEVCINSRDVEPMIQNIQESIDEIFCSDDEFSSINRIHDKLNQLLAVSDMEKRVIISQKTLDKFEDYMKNVDKLNSLINEFKGCVSMARGALQSSKQLSDQTKKTTKREKVVKKKDRIS
jgi:hypothetical protein